MSNTTIDSRTTTKTTIIAMTIAMPLSSRWSLEHARCSVGSGRTSVSLLVRRFRVADADRESVRGVPAGQGNLDLHGSGGQVLVKVLVDPERHVNGASPVVGVGVHVDRGSLSGDSS